MRLLSYFLLAGLLLSAGAASTTECPPAYTFTGEAAEDLFGHSVSGAGDVNNDGFDDLIVGAYGNDAGGNNAGRAYVYSGQSGALLHTFTGEAEGDRFGWSVSGAGDVNSDGFDDLIVGAPLNNAGGNMAGRAYVYSGQSGALLYTFTGEAAYDYFGWSVSGAGDVNNDGFDDLIVGAYGHDAGRAYVYSGQSGALLYTFTGEAYGDYFGQSVSGAGDVNNDNFDDLVVAAPSNDAGGDLAGRAYVYSGESGTLLYTFTGEATVDYFGMSVSGAGDVNNDGFDDLIVGADENDTGGPNAGRAYVYSGQSGALLYTFTGEAAGDHFGWSVSGAGDVNNDGFDDLIVGAFRNGAGGDLAGRAYVYWCGCGDLQFRPNPDGWQFANGESNMWPQSEWEDYTQPQYPHSWRFSTDPSDFPSWPLFVSAFGEDQCYINPPPGQIVYRPSAVLTWRGVKGPWIGSSYGFAVSSFLFYDDFLDVSSEFPGYWDLYPVPLSSSSRSMVNKYWVYQWGEATNDHRNANEYTTTPTQTLEACQQMFYAGAPDDMTLSMWNNQGNGGQTINPYRCEQDQFNPDIWYLYVYDNNFPNDDSRRVEINTTANGGNGSWSYSGQPGWGGAMKLFLELPSSSFTSTPVLPKSIAPRERRTSTEDREGDTISEYIDFYVALADTVLLQSSGGIIGRIGDSLFSTLTDGIPIIPTTGTETPPIGYYLPNDSWSCQFSGLQDSAFHLILFTDSTAMAYFRKDVDSSQHERFLYTGNGSTFWVYNDDPTGRSYSYQMIMIEPDSEVVCEVRDIATSSGDSTRYTRTVGSELQIDNHGESTSYDLRIEIATANLDTVFFHAGIGLDSNSSHRIVPDWRPYGDSVMILVDTGMAGLFSDTMYAVNEGEVFYLCGDIDNSGGVDVADLTYLVDYLFRGGPPPAVPEAADVDGSGGIDVADLTYLVDYLFRGGPEPVCL